MDDDQRWEVDDAPTNPSNAAALDFTLVSCELDSRCDAATALTMLPTIAQVLKRTLGHRRIALPLLQRKLTSARLERWRLAHHATLIHSYTLHWSLLRRAGPRLVYVNNILPPALCSALIARGNATLERSTVVFDSKAPKRKHDDLQLSRDEVHDVRTSYGSFLLRDEDQISVENVLLRVAASYVLGVRESYLEPTQILRYEAGQYYAPHLDYFNPAETEAHRGGQRVATVLVWLNTVADGGETSFPAANTRIAPRRGDAVVFYNVKDGQGLVPDRTSVHAGEPPGHGEVKWVAVLWAHSTSYE